MMGITQLRRKHKTLGYDTKVKAAIANTNTQRLQAIIADIWKITPSNVNF